MFECATVECANHLNKDVNLQPGIDVSSAKTNNSFAGIVFEDSLALLEGILVDYKKDFDVLDESLGKMSFKWKVLSQLK